MSPIDVQTMSVEQLVEQFAAIALDQDRAITLDDSAKYNRLFDGMEKIKDLLRGREGDQRGALAPLLQHSNAQVRLKAAIALLALKPEVARAVLRRISNANEYPQAADARGMLRALDEGRYVPT